MKLMNLIKEITFSGEGPVKKELAVTENFKLLLICFEPGQSVPPCVMSRHTAFHILEGTGTLSASGEKNQPISPGLVAFVAPNLERQIRADSQMVVMAIQYH